MYSSLTLLQLTGHSASSRTVHYLTFCTIKPVSISSLSVADTSNAYGIRENGGKTGIRILKMVARERFELSSAGPKPAMLVHYNRRKGVLPSTGLLRATQIDILPS